MTGQQVTGRLFLHPCFRIEPDAHSSGAGFLESFNAVYVMGGKKMAHVTLCFPRGSGKPGRGWPLRLPLLIPYAEFQEFLSRIE